MGGYFTKDLQGSQFHRFSNIILGIHENDIPSYNASGGEFFEEQKIKIEGDIEEAKKASKLAGY